MKLKLLIISITLIFSQSTFAYAKLDIHINTLRPATKQPTVQYKIIKACGITCNKEKCTNKWVSAEKELNKSIDLSLWRKRNALTIGNCQNVPEFEIAFRIKSNDYRTITCKMDLKKICRVFWGNNRGFDYLEFDNPEDSAASCQKHIAGYLPYVVSSDVKITLENHRDDLRAEGSAIDCNGFEDKDIILP